MFVMRRANKLVSRTHAAQHATPVGHAMRQHRPKPNLPSRPFIDHYFKWRFSFNTRIRLKLSFPIKQPFKSKRARPNKGCVVFARRQTRHDSLVRVVYGAGRFKNESVYERFGFRRENVANVGLNYLRSSTASVKNSKVPESSASDGSTLARI